MTKKKIKILITKYMKMQLNNSKVGTMMIKESLVLLAEENLIRNHWKSILKFVKRFSYKREKSLMLLNNVKFKLKKMRKKIMDISQKWSSNSPKR